ncbi:MAG TPA: alkaline phosphatase [Bryobacteraceae bacterium]|nr:alkaline phosphatase [Bryobacteraceae bacterium]
MNGTNHGVSRRGFLGRAGALASVAGSLEVLHAASKPGAQPKNIIFMVADGMSPSVLPLAEHFSQHVRGKGLLWRALVDRPEAARALMDMASLNSVTTDSSAASSSWGSGVRILNGYVNSLPDGTELTPLAAIARDRRKRVGLVTTTTVTHATPAGFAATEKSRGNEDGIAVQYLAKADVILGGGRQFFEEATRKDKADLIERYRQASFSYVRSRSELKALPAKTSARVLGLFSPGMIPYTLDRNNSVELQESVPTLAEMTSAALDALKSSPKGFLLQIEGGRVDHAAHNNDTAALLWEQLAFDEAIEVALRFAEHSPLRQQCRPGTLADIEVALRFAEHSPETLIVITSDHGNSNPGLGGKWAELNGASNGFARLAKAKSSFAELMPKLDGKQKLASSAVHELMREACGCEFAEDEVEAVRSAAAGVRKLSLNSRLDKLAGILGQAVGNHTGIGWVSTDHTSDFVLLTALGPGSKLFNGQIRNTKCFDNIVDLMGSKFRNPMMTFEQAKRFLRASAARHESRHWV